MSQQQLSIPQSHSATSSPARNKDELKEEVRAVLESFLSSDIRRKDKLFRQESSDAEYRLKFFKSPSDLPSVSHFTPDLRKTSTQLSPTATAPSKSFASGSACFSPRSAGISGQTSIEPKSLSSIDGILHVNTTVSTVESSPGPVEAAGRSVAKSVDVDAASVELHPKKSFYKRVQQSFKWHGKSTKKPPLVKSYSSQQYGESTSVLSYEVCNRSLPIPRKNVSGESAVTRSLDYKKLNSVRPVVRTGSDSWIKSCFVLSGKPKDLDDRSSSYEKATLTDVQSVGKDKVEKKKKLRTKKWYNNNFLSRITKGSASKPKTKQKDMDDTDSRFLQFFHTKRPRFGGKKDVPAPKSGYEADYICDDAGSVERQMANHRTRQGIAALSADAQTGLHSVTKKVSRETKILHRTSGDFKLKETVDSVHICVQSPTSPSSSDSIGLLHLEAGTVRLTEPISDAARTTPPSPCLNDTLNLTDPLSLSAERFDAIADRLSELGDQFISALPIRPEELLVAPSDLTEAEIALVAWVRQSVRPEELLARQSDPTEVEIDLAARLRQAGDRINETMPNNIVEVLRNDGLRRIINRFATNVPVVAQLYFAFRITTAAVTQGGDVSSTAVRQVKDTCVNFIADQFASWIIGHGGWLSAVEDSTSTDTDGG